MTQPPAPHSPSRPRSAAKGRGSRSLRCPFRGRGFAFLLALSMIVLVAAAFVALASLHTHQLNRTVEQARRAQLRQVLLAAGRVAPELVVRWNADDHPASFRLHLPDDLTDRNAACRIRIEPRAAGLERLVHIEAALARPSPKPSPDGPPTGGPAHPGSKPQAERLAQTLRFVQTEVGWALIESRLQ